jgi:8-oxo-dGTP pyrophosphatase MutT (NUDIX family)
MIFVNHSQIPFFMVKKVKGRSSKKNKMQSTSTVTRIHDTDVAVQHGRIITNEDLKHALASHIFNKWVMSLDVTNAVSEITIQGVYYRGAPSGEHVLFVVMSVTVVGAKNPYTIVLRGPTVVILPVFRCKGVEYTLVTLQRRLACGERYFAEIPAGMTDGKDVISKALQELEEETGHVIRQDQLRSLHDVPVQPSPGIMEESMHFFYFVEDIDQKKMDLFRDKLTGAKDEGEDIILKVVRLDELLVHAPHDMKAHFAHNKYRSKHPLRRRWFS